MNAEVVKATLMMKRKTVKSNPMMIVAGMIATATAVVVVVMIAIVIVTALVLAIPRLI